MRGRYILFQCLIGFLLVIKSDGLYAQTDSVPAFSISSNVDLVSRYIWRGQEYGNDPSIQPGLSATWKDFTLGVWGAYSLNGIGMQETDLYLSKEIGPLTFSLWDYWSFGDSTLNLFDYKRNTTQHLLEAQLLLSGGGKLPFNFVMSYLFYGADPSKSIYLELQYLHSSPLADFQLFAGYQAKGDYYGDRHTFVNLGCTVNKSIEITDNWSLPLNLSFIVNPSSKRVYLVAGITI